MQARADFATRVCAAHDTLALRRTVLRPTWTADRPMPGDDAAGVVHIGSFVDDEAISACLVLPEAAPAEIIPAPSAQGWRLRSMATSSSARGTGAGTAVLRKAYEVVSERGCKILWCHARHSATGFYSRDGWIGVGEYFDEIGIDHLLMYRLLT